MDTQLSGSGGVLHLSRSVAVIVDRRKEGVLSSNSRGTG